MKLTAKQTLFCKEYLVDMNASRAAKAAGYSEASACVIGWENLKKPYIREYLDKRLAEMGMAADEAIKLTSDIAKGSLNDYFVIRKVEQRAQVQMPLSEIIKNLQNEVAFEDVYAARCGFMGDELDAHNAQQEQRRRTIIRYEMELEGNPAANMIVQGEPELVDVAELDMVKLVKDKEQGRIKSLTPTQYGTKVELYSASDALVTILKIHGKFQDKIDVTSNGEKIQQTVIQTSDGKKIML